MANKNIKILDNLVSRTKIYLIIILVLLVMICTIRPVFNNTISNNICINYWVYIFCK